MILEEKQQKLLEIEAEVNKRKQSRVPVGEIRGAFGEAGFVTGYIETMGPNPMKGNLQAKFFGCSQLWKGFPEGNALRLISVAKRFLDVAAREFFKKDWQLKVNLVFAALFRRKWLIHQVKTLFSEIESIIVNNIRLPSPKLYTPCASHIRGVLRETFRKTWDAEMDSKMVIHEELNYSGKRDLWIAIACAGEFVAHVLEFDNAYRFRFQDVIVYLNKDNVEKNVGKEISRLLKIMIERENSERMKNKWKKVNLAIQLALKHKEIKKFIKNFLLLIEPNYVAMDESDKYFSCDRTSYNHDGKTHKERVDWMKSIDERDGNVRIVFKNEHTVSPSANA